MYKIEDPCGGGVVEDVDAREMSSSTAYVSQRLSHAGDGQVEAPLPRDRCIGSPRRSQYHGCRMSEVYQLWIALDLKVKDYWKTRLTTLAAAPIMPTIGLPKNRRSPLPDAHETHHSAFHSRRLRRLASEAKRPDRRWPGLVHQYAP
jgi:hypothetical protein